MIRFSISSKGKAELRSSISRYFESRRVSQECKQTSRRMWIQSSHEGAFGEGVSEMVRRGMSLQYSTVKRDNDAKSSWWRHRGVNEQFGCLQQYQISQIPPSECYLPLWDHFLWALLLGGVYFEPLLPLRELQQSWYPITYSFLG